MSSPLPPPAVPTEGAPAPQVSSADGSEPYLQTGWRWVLAAGWGGVVGALGLVADTGEQLGTAPWWLPVLVPPFVLPVLTLIAVARDWRSTLLLSWLATAFLGLSALIDLARGAPAMALAQAVLTVAAAAFTLAATSGRTKAPSAEAT
jgi:hypothetical protein